MPQGYALSEAVRERIWELRAQGLSEREIGRRLAFHVICSGTLFICHDLSPSHSQRRNTATGPELLEHSRPVATSAMYTARRDGCQGESRVKVS